MANLYTEVYEDIRGSIIPLETFIEHKAIYDVTYKFHIFCPDCRQVGLRYVNLSKKPYFGALANQAQSHSDDCEFLHPSNAEYDGSTAVRTKESRVLVRRSLLYAMRYLFQTETDKEETHNNKLDYQKRIKLALNQPDLSSTSNNSTIRRRIICRSNQCAFDDVHVFYGEVYLFRKRKQNGYSMILIYAYLNNNQAKSVFCSIDAYEKILSNVRYLPPIEEGINCYVAFASNIVTNIKNGVTYYNAKINHADEILILPKG